MPHHKKPESERFKGPVKYAEYLVARALVTALQRLPIRFAYRLGRAVGWLAWLTMSGRRRIVRKNLEIVNAWMDGRAAVPSRRENEKNCLSPASELESTIDPHPPSFIRHQSSLALPLKVQVKEVFQRAGANLFAGFTFNRMSPERIEKHIRIEGIEHLKAALSEGKGAIILLAHMGPWEALAQIPELAQREGITEPFGAMYRPLNNAYLDNWVQSQRQAKQTKLFSRRDGFHKPVGFLRAGGMLGILADQKMREGPRVDYFGQKVPSSPIPGLFHRRSGAPLFALSVATTGRAQWHLSLSSVPVPECLNLKPREPLAALCNEAIAQSLAQSPLDGFWLHKRF